MSKALGTVGLVALALVVGETASSRAAGEVVASAMVERWVGTWSGKATWKGCTLDMPGKVALEVGVVGGTLVSDGDVLIDGLGDLVWGSNGEALAMTREGGLEVSLKPGKKGAALLVKTSAGCVGKATLKRATSGMASCDSVRALAEVKASCDGLPAESRGDDLADVEGSWKGWGKLKGKKKTAQAKLCTARVTTLRTEVASCPMAASGIVLGQTGIPACDQLMLAIDALMKCPSLDQSIKDQLKAAMADLPNQLGTMTHETCQPANEMLRQLSGQMGCQIP